jgi:hypothetical protein
VERKVLLEPQILGLVVVETLTAHLRLAATVALVSLSSKSHLRTMPHSHLV